MRTRAKKVGKEYVLNGEKMWITSGTIADVAVIWAKVGSDNGGTEEADSIRGFLVETDRPGFTASDIHGKWSLRASVTSGLSLQDVRIPESNLLLPGSGGLKSPLMCLNQARYGIAWGAIGAAMACYDCALQYSLLRETVPRSAYRLASIGAGETRLDGRRDYEGAATCAARRPLKRRRTRCSTSTSRWRRETTSGWRWSVHVCREIFWEQTAWPTIIPSCVI